MERILAKLHALIWEEIGDDQAPFDLDLFGTRDVTYPRCVPDGGPGEVRSVRIDLG